MGVVWQLWVIVWGIVWVIVHSQRSLWLPPGGPRKSRTVWDDCATPELKVSTPFHTKHPGWYVDLGSRGNTCQRSIACRCDQPVSSAK